MIRGSGASFKLAGATYVLTEIATWLSDIGSDADTDEITSTTFSPGSNQPLKVKLYGATNRGYALTGDWSPTVETFFNAVDGAVDRAYEHSPQGAAVGNVRIYGTVNVGAWSGPQQSASGHITFTASLAVNTRSVETIVTTPATLAITSSSVGDQTTLTTAAHSIPIGSRDVVTIAGHTGSTPSLNGTHEFTALTATTGTIPVSVTVGGTGGTLQK